MFNWSACTNLFELIIVWFVWKGDGKLVNFISILYLDKKKRHDESIHIKSLNLMWNLKWKLWVCAKNMRMKCNFERSHALPVCTHTFNIFSNSLSHEHSSIAIRIDEKKTAFFIFQLFPSFKLYALRTHIHFPVDSLRVVANTITVLMHFTLTHMQSKYKLNAIWMYW